MRITDDLLTGNDSHCSYASRVPFDTRFSFSSDAATAAVVAADIPVPENYLIDCTAAAPGFRYALVGAALGYPHAGIPAIP